jgi:dihydroxy-acid dehydratase
VKEGDTIHFDIPNRKLTLEVSEEELTLRRAAWKAPELRFKKGVFAKYVKGVSSASEGAITN